jgi:hypothetical protein
MLPAGPGVLHQNENPARACECDGRGLGNPHSEYDLQPEYDLQR